MANIITGARIIFSIFLLFTETFSPSFYILYVAAGVSDMIDGPVARSTNTVSEFGSALDSVADFIFVIVCFIKLLPVIKLSTFAYFLIAIVFCIKMINIIRIYKKCRKLIIPHTSLNRFTGVLLFILPLTLQFAEVKYSSLIVCITALAAALDECQYIRKNYLDMR